MKLEIYEEKKNEEKVTRLKLVRYDSGRICLCAIGDYGFVLDNGKLIGFNEDGTISLKTCVDESLGFSLDEDGRIKVKK